MSRYNLSKSQRAERDKMKLLEDKNYAYRKYFSKIEKYFRQIKKKTYGFTIVSLIENENLAELVLSANEYKNKEKIEVYYILRVKIEELGEKEKYYFKLDETDQGMHRDHIDIYILNKDFK